MIDALILYTIFAITTALTSCYLFFYPNLVAAKREGIINEVIEAPWLSCTVYICIAIILAPILFFVILIPALSASYTDKLLTVISDTKITLDS